MGNHLRRGQVRLYLVPADGPVRDDRAAVARALLDRWYPICPVLTDQAMASLGDDLAAIEGLENDPRYLIGRLSQALTALLERDVPPLDATAQLLSEAIEDATNYRRRVVPYPLHIRSVGGAPRTGARRKGTRGYGGTSV